MESEKQKNSRYDIRKNSENVMPGILSQITDYRFTSNLYPIPQTVVSAQLAWSLILARSRLI